MRRWRMLIAVVAAALVVVPAAAAQAKKAPPPSPTPSYPACATFLNGGGVTDQSKIVQWAVSGLTQQAADATAPAACTVNGTAVTYRLRVQDWGCTGCDANQLSPDIATNIDDVRTTWGASGSPTAVTCAADQPCTGTYDAISWTITNPAITAVNPSVNYCLRIDSYIIPDGSTAVTHISSLPTPESGLQRACFQSGGAGGGSGYWG